MDILFFGGQSNMEGQTEAPPADRSDVPGCIEYKLLERKYVPLHHPAGEDVPPYLGGACFGNGSLLPDFCRRYHKFRSDVTVAAVHAAQGATTIDDWDPEKGLYQAAVGKLKAALEDAPEPVEHIYYIWLQGESDAIRDLSEDEYYEKLIRFKNCLKRDCGIEKFGIIRVGYFTTPEKDERIMEAQERAVHEDPDFLLLTRITSQITENLLNPDFINQEYSGHYNNRAMTVVGKDAGETLGRYAKYGK